MFWFIASIDNRTIKFKEKNLRQAMKRFYRKMESAEILRQVSVHTCCRGRLGPETYYCSWTPALTLKDLTEDSRVEFLGF